MPTTATRLNGDTTWLVRFPSGYNLLVDPWLSSSSQEDYHALFSSQSRVVQAQYATLDDVGRALAEGLAMQREGPSNTMKTPAERIDGILLSHPFTDHMHPQSLLTRAEEHETLDVFCSPAAHLAFKKLLDTHSEAKDKYTLHIIPTAPQSSTFPPQTQSLPLPRDVQIYHVPAQESAWTHGPAWSDLHSAIVITSDDASILYSPHGTLIHSYPSWLLSRQGTHSRTLITSFDEQIVPFIRLFTGPVALGFEKAVLPAMAHYRPTHILRTHDEKKTARGLIGKIISRKEVGVEQARGLVGGAYQGEIIESSVGQVLDLGVPTK